MGWRQRNTWVRMAEPDSAILIAQAAPWSPATAGILSRSIIAMDVTQEDQLQKYRGKLAGKIILLGSPRGVAPLEKPLFRRFEQKELSEHARYPVTGPPGEQKEPDYFSYFSFREKLGQFLEAEKVAAALVCSRDNPMGGAGGGTIYVDTNDTFGWFVYQAEHAIKVPLVVLAAEHFGRLSRLLKNGIPVMIEMNVDTEFTGDHEQGFNTLAEIAGTDLKAQAVMVGAHLDSWSAAGGATDDGAGVLIAMEAMRILNALNVKPRRTIRIGLWSGEEQGMLGSQAYVARHLGSFPGHPAQERSPVPAFLKPSSGRLSIGPDHKHLSAYFNLDAGGGRLRGITLANNSALKAIFQPWVEQLSDLGFTAISLRNDCGGDCSVFDAVGIPAPAFIHDPLDYESRSSHTNMDAYERLDKEDLRQASIVVATLLYNTAMRPKMLPRKLLR
ncbi:MAG: M20/M25/M40 family metallo-hydrolase [Bryobacteraceae bacterium]